jgi:hypothetical protein
LHYDLFRAKKRRWFKYYFEFCWEL